MTILSQFNIIPKNTASLRLKYIILDISSF